MKIVDAVNQSADSSAYFVFADLGSAVMNSELAKDLLEEAQQKLLLGGCLPLVEGALRLLLQQDNRQYRTNHRRSTTNRKKGWM